MFVTQLRPTAPVKAGGMRTLERALLVIGVAALGFNLRGAITSLPPVFPELQDGLGLSTRDDLGARGHPGPLLRRLLRLRRVAEQAAGRGTRAAGRHRGADRWPAAARRGARRAAVSRDRARGRRDRHHERAALQPDQAAVAGTRRLPDRPLHHRAVRRRDHRVGRRRAALEPHRRLGGADARLAGRPRGARGPAVAAAGRARHQDRQVRHRGATRGPAIPDDIAAIPGDIPVLFDDTPAVPGDVPAASDARVQPPRAPRRRAAGAASRCTGTRSPGM